jgi:hypothetical protein
MALWSTPWFEGIEICLSFVKFVNKNAASKLKSNAYALSLVLYILSNVIVAKKRFGWTKWLRESLPERHQVTRVMNDL